MTGVLDGLGAGRPVLAAPMAGGAGGPELVRAAAEGGGLGFLAAGYKTAETLAAQIREVRATTSRFGVNLFAPNPVPVDTDELAAYAAAIQGEGTPYGLDLTAVPVTEDDDDWDRKVELLTGDPVPLVSFTFGIPDSATVQRFRRAGSLTVQTVTDAAEARAATEAGVDALVVQAASAGGHSGTLTPDRLPADVALTELLASVRSASALPLLAAGGIATPDAVRDVFAAGAVAAVVGTVLLRSEESGASAPHRAALADPARRETVLTRAFTGRPARALRNRFVEEYDAIAPAGYPAVHHLTGPLRKAATAAGDPELVHLWAGTGFRHATAEPAGDILRRLASGL